MRREICGRIRCPRLHSNPAACGLLRRFPQLGVFLHIVFLRKHLLEKGAGNRSQPADDQHQRQHHRSLGFDLFFAFHFVSFLPLSRP